MVTAVLGIVHLGLAVGTQERVGWNAGAIAPPPEAGGLDAKAMLPPRNLLVDFEGVETGQGRKGRAQPGDEGLDRFGCSLHLDGGALGVIADMTRKAEGLREPEYRGAKADALHGTPAAQLPAG